MIQLQTCGRPPSKESRYWRNPNISARREGTPVKRRSLWITCPICDSKTRVKVFENTILLNFPLFCPRCKKETVINVVKLKMVICKEPDA
ncbi:MAG: cysteine-rich KTR domain-containing protein [Clostridia bacterium]|nr:cysteine-rich KTR domain-containing protein [Clostridia bacterium]